MHIIKSNNDIDDTPLRIIITGANGFTGRHACTYFATNGYNVFAIVRTPTTFEHERIQTVLCDLTDKASLQTTIQTIQPHFILHLAGQNAVQVSWERPIDTFVTNVMCTAYLLDAVRLQGSPCKTIIAGSILQANPADPTTFEHPYSLSKTMQALYSEVFSLLFEMNVIIAKPSNLIGPGKSAGICSILANKVVKMEQGKEPSEIVVHNLLAARDFLDVRDVVRAYEVLLLKGKVNTVYEITSGTTRHIQEVIEIYKRISIIDFQIKSEITQPETIREFDTIPMKLLGWSPSISFEQSLHDILQYARTAM